MWLKYYALQIGVPLDYYPVMPMGELLDLIACFKIAHGVAKAAPSIDDDDDDLFPDLI